MPTHTIGFIGLGQMGIRMARHLMPHAKVLGYDINDNALANHVEHGGLAANSITQIIAECETIFTCLVSHHLLPVMDETILPAARAGQIYVDHSTIPATQSRRLGSAFAGLGASYLDAPMTGGTGGAEHTTLRMFVGGDQEAFTKVRPLLAAMTADDGLHYAGASGQGQVMKVVQQLKNRLLDAARLEIIAFGLRDGLTIEQVAAALDLSLDSHDPYAALLRAISAGDTDQFSCLFGEWPYCLEEAAARHIPMPLLESLYQFCKDGDRVNTDGQSRPGPSVFNELMKQTGPALKL
jgi:3-hydroxyisobutyrate dehydrogenase-like beta-hydroxyacid dehydrogenase